MIIVHTGKTIKAPQKQEEVKPEPQVEKKPIKKKVEIEELIVDEDIKSEQ